jgi:predicted DNA-binding transcriptional regulator AlpA
MDVMKGMSTRQVAKSLGLSHAALVRYMADGKIPTPNAIQFGGFRAHLWTEAEIEHVRQLLPKIANGRKTRYSKLREKQKAQPKTAVPHKTKKKK